MLAIGMAVKNHPARFGCQSGGQGRNLLLAVKNHVVDIGQRVGHAMAPRHVKQGRMKILGAVHEFGLEEEAVRTIRQKVQIRNGVRGQINPDHVGNPEFVTVSNLHDFHQLRELPTVAMKPEYLS